MSLQLIVGPPNSGRADAVLDGLVSAREREPILVVPGGDDVAGFERALCAHGDAAIGVEITAFERLIEGLAQALGLPAKPPLSGPQRRALVSLAISGTDLRALRRSAAGSGFAPAVDELIAELEAALIDPKAFAERGAQVPGGVEAELARLYAEYVGLRDRAGRIDASGLAAPVLDALTRDPDAWGGRPLFVYGFDQLTAAQRALIAELARNVDVTVALTYADRDALAASADLAAELREGIGVDEEVVLEHDGSYTASPALDHLDRHLFDAEASPVEPDDGLVLMESAGERGEFEAIALEAARLIAEGVSPDEILVVLRHPSSRGPLLAAVLDEMGVPAALEAHVPLESTGTGGSLVALCRAATRSGTAEDLLAHMRLDPAATASVADHLERSIRRRRMNGVDEAIADWAAPPRHLARLRDTGSPGERLRALARSSREIAEAAHRGGAPLAERNGSDRAVPFVPLELRAGATAAALLDELAAVGELPGCAEPDLAEAIAAIEGASVPAWRGPADGRVRILGPHRARGARARFVFCASLQDGEFPSASPANPLLGDERRAELGFPALRRRDAQEEERFLFASCVSRPTERLYLSWRASAEDGGALARSPFVDDVLDLMAPDPETAEADLVRTRGLERVVPDPAEAPTQRQLDRALAITRQSDPTDEELPGPLRAEPVLAAIRERGGVSANSLEQWLGCPHRWFVDHELRPVRLEATSDPLWLGGVVHEALELLYSEAPGADAIPRPGDVYRWKARLGELLDEVGGEGATGTERRAALARARIQVEAFLDEEARLDTPFRPRADLLEWRFGMEEGDPGPLELGGLALHGIVDRIDVDADGRTAIVRDYKTSKEVPGAASFTEKGTLQVPLYMVAVRDLLGFDVIGGLYQPLGAYRDRRARGLVLGDERTEGLELVRGRDVSDRDTLDERLDEVLDRARKATGEMRDGKIGRRPLGGRCPKYCHYQAICRLERGLGDPAGESEDED